LLWFKAQNEKKKKQQAEESMDRVVPLNPPLLPFSRLFFNPLKSKNNQLMNIGSKKK